MADIRIGFVGAGRIAQAIARGIAGTRPIAAAPAWFLDPSDEAAARFAQRTTARAAQIVGELARECDLLVLAVKPANMPAVIAGLSEAVSSRHLIVSVAAGITLETLAALGTSRLVRVMPNTPCLIGQGISALSWGEGTTPEDRNRVREIFGSVGQVVEVPESMLDAVTGLSGSGPAYVYLMIEALTGAGVGQGLPPDIAATLAAHTVRGAGSMVIETGRTPAELRSDVTSPGGTTLAGLEALEQTGFRHSLEEAVAAATRRAGELRMSARS